MEQRTNRREMVVPLLELKAGANAVRIEEADDELVELAESIRREGLINAIGVEETPDGLVVVHGHRRYAACRMAGVVEVPVVVFAGSRSDLGRVIFAENHNRKDPSPIEEAHAMAERIEAGDMTIEEVATVFRRSVGWVKEQIAMLSWPGELLEAVHSRVLNKTAGAALAQVTDEAYRDFLMRHAIEGGATGRTVESWVSAWFANLPPDEAVTLEAASPAAGALAPTPMAPCLCCGEPFTYDQLSNVLICVNCVPVVGALARGRQGRGRPGRDRGGDGQGDR